MGDLGYFLGLIGGQYLRGAKSLKLPGFYMCLGLFRYYLLDNSLSIFVNIP